MVTESTETESIILNNKARNKTPINNPSKFLELNPLSKS